MATNNVDVNPPGQLRIPAGFNAEQQTFFDQIRTILFQLERRTSGELSLQDDTDDENFGSEVVKSRADISQIFDLLGDIEASSNHAAILRARIDEIFEKAFYVVSKSVNYTTAGNQIIICTNSSPINITLNLTPDDFEEVHIKRQNSSVSIIGTIDGSSPSAIPSKYDSVHLIYSSDAGEWLTV